jgi:hypothetical protein
MFPRERCRQFGDNTPGIENVDSSRAGLRRGPWTVEEERGMNQANKQPPPPNAFANQGRPAFAEGGSATKKLWAITCTVGFGVFWFAGLFLAAELFGTRDLTLWPMVLTPLGFLVGTLGRIMMARETA